MEPEAFLSLNPLLFIWSSRGNCPPRLTVLCHLRRNFPVRCRHSRISRNVLTFYPTWQVQLWDPHTPLRGVHGRPLPSEFPTLSCLPRPLGWGRGGEENPSGCFLSGPQSRPEILQRGTESISLTRPSGRPAARSQPGANTKLGAVPLTWFHLSQLQGLDLNDRKTPTQNLFLCH